MSDLLYDGKRAVVVGYGVTGRAVADFLTRSGASVRVFDDGEIGMESSHSGVTVSRPGEDFRFVVEQADLVVVSPGVPRSHPVYGTSSSPVSELELAYRHAAIPMIAVTGTNGKTTVTTLITEMLSRAGLRARAVGNIGTSIISMLDVDLDYFVVEASSFQLATIESFRPRVAVWTNFTPDHLDWHLGIDHYKASKARIFENQGRGDVAIVNGSDPVVSKSALAHGVRRLAFGLGRFDFGLSEDRSALVGEGKAFLNVSEMSRAFPHDLENALASAAAAFSIGVDLDDIAAVLRGFKGLSHRVELVGTLDGVSFYDDSKATTPASVMAAVGGFESVVLIAGGKNKGLDLSPLASLSSKLKSVIAIGDAAGDIVSVFSEVPGIPVATATSMTEAVAMAFDSASAGDSVLLSPGCTSFDWYKSYGERGDDFRAVVESLILRGGGA